MFLSSTQLHSKTRLSLLSTIKSIYQKKKLDEYVISLLDIRRSHPAKSCAFEFKIFLISTSRFRFISLGFLPFPCIQVSTATYHRILNMHTLAVTLKSKSLTHHFIGMLISSPNTNSLEQRDHLDTDRVSGTSSHNITS